MHKLGMALFAGMLMGALGCDDGAADTAGNAAICQRICNAANECNSDIDRGDCRMECVDESKNDVVEEKAEDCAKCLERDNNCGENIAECAAQCAGIVSLSAT